MTAQVSSEGTRSVLISRVHQHQTDLDSAQAYTTQVPTHTAQSLPALQTSPICMIASRDYPGRAPARTPGHVLRDLRGGPRLTCRQDVRRRNLFLSPVRLAVRAASAQHAMPGHAVTCDGSAHLVALRPFLGLLATRYCIQIN